MIPNIKPPFGPSRVISAILSFVDRTSIEEVEAAYSQAYNIPYVILLPSCRAGLRWALQACISQGTRVICPVYTCMVVWEAIVRAGGEIHMIDTRKNSFLMDASSLAKVQTGDYAIILCEIYGYTYDLSRITSLSEKDPILRIVDMAMTVPTRKLFERLSDSDFALTSFGREKCMDAGWGGMGFTRDKLLADKVRKLRDSSLKSCNFTLFVKRSMKIIALSFSYEPLTYKFFRKIRDTKRSIRHRSIAHSSGSKINSIAERLSLKDWYCPPTNEWLLPTTYVDRHLMLYNLKNAEQYCERKNTFALRYHKNLDGVPGIVRPDISSDALSHYTIRVKPSLRPLFLKDLYESNIDGGTLFFFPDSFSKNDYPNASRIASEVINLPLDVRLGIEDIEWISQRVAYAAEHCK